MAHNYRYIDEDATTETQVGEEEGNLDQMSPSDFRSRDFQLFFKDGIWLEGVR